MDLNIKIKDLDYSECSKHKINCLNCCYWFECSKIISAREFNKSFRILDFLKSLLFEFKSRKSKGNLFSSFMKNGGSVKAAFSGKDELKGMMVYGSHYLFPRLKEFKVYPVDSSSIFLACMFIEPGYQDFGVGERLLLSVEKDALKQGRKSLETIAKRQNEDMPEDEFESLHLMPFKFLIKNGFYVKKNDEYFPLLRLDLSTIETVISEEESLFARLFAKKELSRSTFINAKNSKNIQ
jgi:GNAT superfamily N-acetyltransferase